MQGVGGIVDSVGLALTDIAMDDEYLEEQMRQREAKEIRNIGQGFVEAGKRGLEAVEGLFDFVAQPIKGAQAEGIQGFFTGLGKGLVGTIVKPVSKVGEAISDVTTGVSRLADYTDPYTGRTIYPRNRLPRVFYGVSGSLQEFSQLDAFIRDFTGSAFQDAELFLTVPTLSKETLGILVLEAKRLVYLELILVTGQLSTNWELLMSYLIRVKSEASHLLLTDLMNSVYRCRLPVSSESATCLVNQIQAGLTSRMFNWKPLKNLLNKARFESHQ